MMWKLWKRKSWLKSNIFATLVKGDIQYLMENKALLFPIFINIYRITSVLKVITNICRKLQKTNIIVFIGNVMCMTTSHWPIISGIRALLCYIYRQNYSVGSKVKFYKLPIINVLFVKGDKPLMFRIESICIVL
jgi:hypothetical protein